MGEQVTKNVNDLLSLPKAEKRKLKEILLFVDIRFSDSRIFAMGRSRWSREVATHGVKR